MVCQSLWPAHASPLWLNGCSQIIVARVSPKQCKTCEHMFWSPLRRSTSQEITFSPTFLQVPSLLYYMAFQGQALNSFFLLLLHSLHHRLQPKKNSTKCAGLPRSQKSRHILKAHSSACLANLAPITADVCRKLWNPAPVRIPWRNPNKKKHNKKRESRLKLKNNNKVQTKTAAPSTSSRIAEVVVLAVVEVVVVVVVVVIQW